MITFLASPEKKTDLLSLSTLPVLEMGSEATQNANHGIRAYEEKLTGSVGQMRIGKPLPLSNITVTWLTVKHAGIPTSNNEFQVSLLRSKGRKRRRGRKQKEKKKKREEEKEKAEVRGRRITGRRRRRKIEPNRP